MWLATFAITTSTAGADIADYGVIVLGRLMAAFVVASTLGRFVRLSFLA